MGQKLTTQLEKTLNLSRTWEQPPRISDFSMRGHMLSSSTTKEHVSRGRLITTASHHRRRSRLWISRPNRNSKAPPIFTANIFGLLISERIDRFGEISSTTVHRKHPSHASSPFPPESFTLLQWGHKQPKPRLKHRNKIKLKRLNPKRLEDETRRRKAVIAFTPRRLEPTTAELKKLPRHGDKRPAATDLWEPPSLRNRTRTT